MKSENLLLKIILITLVMIGAACLGVSINNRWKIPNSSLSVLLERVKSPDFKDAYRRTLILEDDYKTKNKIVMMLEKGDYSRTNIYRTSDKTFLLKDFWNDYEVNTETKILKKIDATNRVNGGEYVGAFDENESGGWRYIPAAERGEIALGELKLK